MLRNAVQNFNNWKTPNCGDMFYTKIYFMKNERVVFITYKILKLCED